MCFRDEIRSFVSFRDVSVVRLLENEQVQKQTGTSMLKVLSFPLAL